MKKTIGILLLAAFVALSFTACSGGGGGGSSFIDKITGKKTVEYGFANKNFGFKSGDAREAYFQFSSDTAVVHTFGGVAHPGTYTNVKEKSGVLNITYTDGTAAFSKAFTFTDDGNKVTGVMIDGLAYSTY